MLKFTSKEAHIDDLMDRRLHMNAAGYYHGLPGEQSVSLVASGTVKILSQIDRGGLGPALL